MIINPQISVVSGVVQTVFLSNEETVPEGAFYHGGLAYTTTGAVYVCAYPQTDAVDDPTKVTFMSGHAIRKDGALVIIDGGSITRHLSGLALTDKGELCVTTDALARVVHGIPVSNDGEVCVSELSDET